MSRDVPLSEIVSVRSRFSRSVALVRDWENENALEGYILTPSGQDALGRLAAAMRSESPSRAWSITGPYGTGKSAFALFAAQALCGCGAAGNQARAALKAGVPALWRSLFQGRAPLSAERLCPVLLTGSRGSLETALVERQS